MRITVSTEIGDTNLYFDTQECLDRFNRMKERDKQQIALSRAIYKQKYRVEIPLCAECGEKVKIE